MFCVLQDIDRLVAQTEHSLVFVTHKYKTIQLKLMVICFGLTSIWSLFFGLLLRLKAPFTKTAYRLEMYFIFHLFIVESFDQKNIVLTRNIDRWHL